MRRREFTTLLGGAAVSSQLRPLRARAQQAGRIYRIGFLGGANDPADPPGAADRDAIWKPWFAMSEEGRRAWEDRSTAGGSDEDLAVGIGPTADARPN